MSATRVLLTHHGEDRLHGTEDDGVYLLDDLGGSNRIAALPVGPLDGPPIRLDDATAILGVDERLLILSDLGASNTVTPVAGVTEKVTVLSSRNLLVTKPGIDGLYFLSLDDPELHPVDLPPLPFCCHAQLGLSSTSFVGMSWGEGYGPSPDDVVYVLRDLGGKNERFVLPAPFADSVFTQLSAERVILRSGGASREFGDADDQILLLDHLLDVPTDPTVTALPVPRMKDEILPVALGPDLAAMVTSGSNAPSGPEDGVAVLSGFGLTNVVTQVPVGPLSNWPSYESPHLSQPLRLGPRALVLGGLGADGSWPTPDDEVVTLTDVGGANRVERTVVGDLWRSGVAALAPAGAVVLTRGADSVAGTSDDAVVSLSGIGTALEVQTVEVGHLSPPEGLYDLWWTDLSRVLNPLGNRRALLEANQGHVDEHGYCESRLHLLSDLPGGMLLEADEIRIRRAPGEPARIRAAAELVLPNPDLFARSDLTIRVGNASQTIVAEHITRNANGFHYLDMRGRHGWLRRVEYDAVAGRIEISGRGQGIGAGSTRARNLILSLESRDFQIAQTLDGKARPSGISYRRP